MTGHPRGIGVAQTAASIPSRRGPRKDGPRKDGSRKDGPRDDWWSLPASALWRDLGADDEDAAERAPVAAWSDTGLSAEAVARRRAAFGPNEVRPQRVPGWPRVLLEQVRSPLLLLLVFAAIVAVLTRAWADAALVLSIIVISAGIGAWREHRAQRAAAALRAAIKTRAQVVRDGGSHTIGREELVPGDVILLAAGSLVPADAVVLEASDCTVNQAVLTGESFPVDKRPGTCAPEAPLAARGNAVLLGSTVCSGSARALVVRTGADTAFGAIAGRLALRPPETEFDRGLRHFGYLLGVAMLVMVLLVFAVHQLAHRPVVETLLFAVALAVGLSPELLPAILSVNLARGAEVMARHGVLVRHLSAIENLGSMNILCTDKTGTLTEGVVRLEGAYDPAGVRAQRVLDLAALNAACESGIGSPFDDAILAAHVPDLSAWRKRGEIPFDFVRKRVSVVLEGRDGVSLITKGAFDQLLSVCDKLPSGGRLDPESRAAIEQRIAGLAQAGMRVLGVATRQFAAAPQDAGPLRRQDEVNLTFEGFLAFADRPKEGAARAIADLARLGVTLKLITGDGRLVATHVAAQVGLPHARLLTGRDLDELHDEALWHAAERTDVFAEVDPNQKERIILALKKMGHVVGFLGDGVNDAPAMHAADTSLSVEGAADVAREAADFVLLERHLDVIKRGIEEGRRTFANTLKYVLTTTSANLGNMASMAGASLFLPFLPLTAGQILLNNFLSDIPAVGLATDSVDAELIARPRRWDLGFVGRFMIEFGGLSSAFDLLTFAVLLRLFEAPPPLFRTGWFVESLLTELVIALVVRTRGPFWRSRPGRLLLISTGALVGVTLALPYLPGVAMLGFVPLPASLVATLVAITTLYVLAAELAKRWLYR